MDTYSFMISQAATIESKVYETRYPSILYPVLAPTISEGNPRATSVVRFVRDRTGKAKRIANYAEDWPNVATSYATRVVKTDGVGASYQITAQDAANAMAGGFDLAADQAVDARRTVEEELDRLFRVGDSRIGWDKHYDTTINHTVATAAFTAANDEAKILAVITDVNKAIAEVFSRTKRAFLPDTLCLPPKAYVALAGLPYRDHTVLNWLRTGTELTGRTGQPLMIYAYDSNDSDALLYARDPDVLKFHLPMPATVRGPDIKRYGTCMEYGVEARTGGLEWRIKDAAQRITGVAA